MVRNARNRNGLNLPTLGFFCAALVLISATLAGCRGSDVGKPKYDPSVPAAGGGGAGVPNAGKKGLQPPPP